MKILLLTIAIFFASGASAQNKHNGHEYVDLGLSVKWATCNVGADSPEEYGDYYAWGETDTKSSYSYANCSTFGRSVEDITGTNYDVAHVKWGGNWRMPTESEFRELINECDWEWNGYGYTVTGPNGNSIFLSAAGSRYDDELGSDGSIGYYWSSTRFMENINNAEGLYFSSKYKFMEWSILYGGHSIRPVIGEIREKVHVDVAVDELTMVTNDKKIDTPDLFFTEDASEFDDFELDMFEIEEEILENDEIFTILEHPATFKGGGLGEFHKWAMEHVKYPQIAQEMGITGNVILEFVIDEMGLLGRIKVLQSPDPLLTEAAISVLQKSPKWKPGKHRGKAVKMKFVLPISFKMQN